MKDKILEFKLQQFKHQKNPELIKTLSPAMYGYLHVGKGVKPGFISESNNDIESKEKRAKQTFQINKVYQIHKTKVGIGKLQVRREASSMISDIRY